MDKLTKTDFISYRECNKNVWVKWHKPEVYANYPISEFEQSLSVIGNEVEELARGMFSDGYLINGRNEHNQRLTRKLIEEKTPVIYQAVFSTDKFLAATDILKWNEEAEAYDLYEIKMSSTKEENEGEASKRNGKKELQYEYDISFQINVAEACGVSFNKKYLVRLNKEYVRMGKLNYEPNQLFILEDKTQEIKDLKGVAMYEMEEAFSYLSQNKMPEGHCSCYYKGRSSHCTTFNYINPDVPEYSVHDLNRIGNSKKYLSELIFEGVLHISDVPIDDRLKPKEPKRGEEPSKPKKLNQVLAHKSQKPIINFESLKIELDSLQFPLYFLDYETYPTAIPPFDGYHPYQQIVFQYSLHKLNKKGDDLEHYECLITDGDPAERIAKSLKENIGNKGTIIVWYKNFENSRNRELSLMLPGYSDFFNSLIKRTYDLMDIVENQHYIHPNFKGKSSIKKVAPVLVPHVSYKTLGVQNGTDAIEAYRQIKDGKLKGDDLIKKKNEMLEYCCLDTKAMYELWKFFDCLVNDIT